MWQKDGYTFDAGPTVITDPPCLEELWALSGQTMADDVTLEPVTPFYRLMWNDGTAFDYSQRRRSAGESRSPRSIPADVAGYRRFLDYAAGVYQEGYVKLGAMPFLDFAVDAQGRAGDDAATRRGGRSIRSCQASSATKSCARRCRSTPCWSAAIR